MPRGCGTGPGHVTLHEDTCVVEQARIRHPTYIATHLNTISLSCKIKAPWTRLRQPEHLPRRIPIKPMAAPGGPGFPHGGPPPWAVSGATENQVSMHPGTGGPPPGVVPGGSIPEEIAPYIQRKSH